MEIQQKKESLGIRLWKNMKKNWILYVMIAPVVVYAGEDEMLSLALGGLRVLRGEETAKTFVKNENPGY